jgi:hypothetical protein
VQSKLHAWVGGEEVAHMVSGKATYTVLGTTSQPSEKNSFSSQRTFGVYGGLSAQLDRFMLAGEVRAVAETVYSGTAGWTF